MVFGDYDTTTSAEKAVFERRFDFIGEMIGARTRLGRVYKLVFPAKNLAFARAGEELHAHLERLIKRALRERQLDRGERKERRYCLLDELLAATDDLEQVRWEIMSLVAAGRDTTASFLSHLVHNLVRQPEVWARLLDEISVLNGQPPDFEALQRMKYVKHVLNESESAQLL